MGAGYQRTWMTNRSQKRLGNIELLQLCAKTARDERLCWMMLRRLSRALADARGALH